MSYHSQAQSAYAAASKAVSPLQAVVMLYDGMIRSISAAKLAIEEERIEDRFNHTKKASQILLGLQANLDFEKGGEVSPMLSQFYDTIFMRIQRINSSNSIEICDEIVRSLSNVRKSWHELATTPNAQVSMTDAIQEAGGSVGLSA
ncbi:flagellar export chaperone FliS [Pelagibius sp. Alg239-R121]|uniref:flagellar export chaperone FliS n=1 Tax=Pelagibius sp. Alg239-R121 TaxID=2993448 RepID=UPI0024A61ED2|nr:flagellar export chaperone FliS [Pelagibius sp. Alg239-R121]